MDELSKMEQLHGDLRSVLDDGVGHVSEVNTLMKHLHRLHIAKENTYNLSFSHRGLIGIWHNVARKYDVIDTLGRKDAYTTVMIDALIDVALYALKLVIAIRKVKPEVFKEWWDTIYRNYVDDAEEEMQL